LSWAASVGNSDLQSNFNFSFEQMELIHAGTNAFVLVPLLFHGKAVVSLLSSRKMTFEDILAEANCKNSGVLNVFLRALVISCGLEKFDEYAFFKHAVPAVPQSLFDFWKEEHLDERLFATSDSELSGSFKEKVTFVLDLSRSGGFLAPLASALLVERVLFSFYRRFGIGTLDFRLIKNVFLKSIVQALFVERNLLVGDELSMEGSYIANRTLLFGLAESYRPLLSRFGEMLFGDCSSVFSLDASGHESHVDRLLNVQLSGFWHKKYFSEVESVLREFFDSEDFSNQPQYVCDMGCGDGSFLKKIFQFVLQETRRGKELSNYPLMMIGADFSEESLQETARVLTLAQVPHVTVFGDIGDPVALIRSLRQMNIDDQKVMHVRSFLDHDRPFKFPARMPHLVCFEDGAFMRRNGELLPADIVVASLDEHLANWSRALAGNPFGMLILEVHNIGIDKTREKLNDLESFHFDVTQGLSGQFVVSLGTFLESAARVGLFVEGVKVFPSLEYPRISLCRFFHRTFQIRHIDFGASKSRLLELEEAWSSGLSSSEQLLRERVEIFNTGQFELVLDGRVISALYSQPIFSLSELQSGTADSSLFDLAGKTLQLIGAVSEPSALLPDPANELILFVLRLAPLYGFREVVGVTRWSGFQRWKITHPLGTPEEYFREDVDPTVNWHKRRGARVLQLLKNFRPKDVENEGYGVLITYSVSESRSGLVAIAAEKHSLQKSMKELVAEIIGVAVSEVANTDSLFSIGLDSLGIFELREKIAINYGIPIPSATLFFKYSKVGELEDFFTQPKQNPVTSKRAPQN
jgi:acyl carrier protein